VTTIAERRTLALGQVGAPLGVDRARHVLIIPSSFERPRW
jgi:hypothetical protein